MTKHIGSTTTQLARQQHQEQEVFDINKFRLEQRRPIPPSVLNFSIPHMLRYAIKCLQYQTGVTQLRHVGIVDGQIQQAVYHSHRQLSTNGYDHIKYEFPLINCVTNNRTPIVKFDAMEMLELGKHSIYSTEFNNICSLFVDKYGLGYRLDSRPNVIAHVSMLHGNSLLNSIVRKRETCFILPFRTIPSSGVNLLNADTNCRELNSRLAVLGRNDAFFENSVHDGLGKYSIIVTGRNYMSLISNSWLDDSIINFFMRWLMFQRFPGDNSCKVHVFNTHFLSFLERQGYTDDLKRWLRNAGDIFDKKFLIFPCHTMSHWSLLVVVNAGKMMQTHKRWGDSSYTGEVAGMFHLDPLGSAGHSYSIKQSFARSVRNALNSEWDHRHNNGMDRLTRPFTHRDSFKLHCPSGE